MADDQFDIYGYMLEQGMPQHVAEAFMDSFQSESGLNAGINEIEPLVPGSRGGRGLYQLTGPRRDAYEETYGTGYDPKSQIDHLLHELETTEKSAAEAIYGTDNRADAVRAITSKFLRPAVDNSDHRINAWDGGQRYASLTANPDGSISRNKGVNHNASANNGGEKKVSKDEGPAYKALPFGIGEGLQAGLAEKIGGERMAGMGKGMMGLSQQIMNGEFF